MTRIAIINSFYKFGSTGTLCDDFKSYFNSDDNYYVKVFYGRGPRYEDENSFMFSNKLNAYLDAFLTRIDDRAGFHSNRVTRKLISQLENFKPDIIFLHNLHGYYLNIEILFQYLRNNQKIKIFWLFHDCWPITGHCVHFENVKCSKWKNGCNNCPNKKRYPSSRILDNSKDNWLKKRYLFSNIPNLTIISPSYWLQKYVKKSFFANNEIKVIHNGIDTDIFNYNKPTKDNLILNLKKQNFEVILFVANEWDSSKGLLDVVRLSKILPYNIKIVLVGHIKKHLRLPSNILFVDRTSCQQDLADFYRSADALFNFSYEDNFPTIILEALACHCPVISYNTGGSQECLDKKYVVNQGDFTKCLELFKTLKKKLISYSFPDINYLDKKRMLISYKKIFK